jgi:hypothetical protein
MLKLRDHLKAHRIAAVAAALVLVVGSASGYLVGHSHGYAAGNFAGVIAGYDEGRDAGTAIAADCLADPAGGADAHQCEELRSKVAHAQLDIAHHNFVHDPLPVVLTTDPTKP